MKPPEKKRSKSSKIHQRLTQMRIFPPFDRENHTSLCETFIINMYICWQWFDALEMAFVRSRFFVLTFRNVNTRQSDFDEYRARKKNTSEQKRTKFLVKYLNVSLFAISWYFGRLFAFGTFVCWSFWIPFFFLSRFSLCSHWRSNRRMNSLCVCQIDCTDCRAQRFYSFKCICSNDEIIIKILFLDVHKKRREKRT